jgi:hypothetical protein
LRRRIPMRCAARIAPVAGIVAVCAGCAGILGLDAGVGDGPDASADGEVDELPAIGEARGDSTDDAADAIGPVLDSAGAPDAPDPPEGGCPFTACPDGCDDTGTDPQDCGGCAIACLYGPNSQPVCTGGVCGLQCTGGALDCDHQASDGCECAPVPNGTLNCTATAGCGHVCDQGYVDCAGGPCSCGAGMRCLSDDTCGACRATLQPCQLGTDCCSGSCGASSTCL